MALEHVGIILDGNGRWAQQRGRPHRDGHHVGAENALRIVKELTKTRIRFVTLYAFSTENWERPATEVENIFELLILGAREHIADLVMHNIVVQHLGRRTRLPNKIINTIDWVVGLTASNDGLTVSIACDYGGREEITEAARRICKLGLGVRDVTEDLVSAHLYLPEVPDVDLVIRTGGERRLSNFLIWQAAKSGFHVTETLWPDFDKFELTQILQRYQDE